MLTAMPIALAAQAVAAVNEQLAAGAFRLPGKKVATTIEPACDYYIAEASFKRQATVWEACVGSCVLHAAWQANARCRPGQSNQQHCTNVHASSPVVPTCSNITSNTWRGAAGSIARSPLRRAARTSKDPLPAACVSLQLRVLSRPRRATRDCDVMLSCSKQTCLVMD